MSEFDIKNKNGYNNAKQIYDIYHKMYEFPEWVLDKNIWNKLNFELTTLYYNQNDLLSDIKKIAKEREPTNIAMNRIYKQDHLEKVFGWRIGYYERFLENNKYSKLPPNIAIYAKTPIMIDNVCKSINVINLIGYAFDSEKQPDMKYFIKNRLLNNLEILISLYTNIWKYAFYCALDKGLDYIHVSAVGGGVFAPRKYSGIKFTDNILKPAINNAQKEIDPNDKIQLIWLKYPQFVIPYSLKQIDQKNIDKTLYVNAWDPFSLVGNGNKMDQSLDGAFGQSTALGVLCWPLTNPYMKYRNCDLD